MRKFRLIPWNGRTYKAVEINLYSNKSNSCVALIAEDNLEKELVDLETNKWINPAAKKLDDQITFYVNENMISMPPEELADWVEQHLSSLN